MGKPGGKPTPTKLKLLRGNPGKRRVNTKEPQPRPITPEPSDWLDEEAKTEWYRIIKEMQITGIATLIDRAVLEGYCVAYAEWKKAQRIIYEVETKSKMGAVIKTPNGMIQAIPQVSMARNSLILMLRLAAELGMTPSARTRLTGKGGDGQDPEEKYFGY